VCTLPVAADGRRAARKVTKIGPASVLRKERDNYERYVGRDLPFCVAQVKEYYEQADQAALNYVFVGGGALGQAVSLEEYYHTHTVDEVIATLSGLLDRELGPIWYGQPQPLNCFFSAEYGRHLPKHQKLERITAAAFRDLPVGGDQVQLPGVAGEYPNPLRVYARILDKTLEGRRSYVHGDLHLRNVLVDESGVGRLIDFAKVGERHNLFDFIKLETYVRLMELARAGPAFSLDNYVQFENDLDAATLSEILVLPDNLDLQFACQTIQAIREIARKYMGPGQDFRNEYFPALLLYNLAATKYYQKKDPQPTRLAFATACVLGRYVLGLDREVMPSMRGQRRHPARQEMMTDGPRQNHTESAPSSEAARAPQQAPSVNVNVVAGNQYNAPGGQMFIKSNVAFYDSQPSGDREPPEPARLPTQDTAAIRKLLTGTFDDETLTTFCYDHFRPVYEQLSIGMSKVQKVQRLLDYCERHDQLDTLLRLVKECR
jgi:hypothetical protein